MGRYLLQLEVLLTGRTTPRAPHFVRVVYTTGVRPLIGHSFLTVNNSRMTVLQKLGGHGGRVVTLLPPTSEAGVRFLAQPQVGKLVVACLWLAVYSTEP